MAGESFPAVDLEPPEETITRNLVVLLLDARASMREVDSDSSGRKHSTTKEAALRAALDVFLGVEVHDEAKLEANGELAILSFGNNMVTPLALGTPVAKGSPFHFIRYVHSAPHFRSNGNTPMGAAIKQALQVVNDRKDSLAASGITHEFRPNIFLLTDGKPNDPPGVLDRAVEELHAFHVPVFQKVPRPSFPGMQTLRDLLAPKYSGAMSLKESDIADASFIDELERNGFIDRLYAG